MRINKRIQNAIEYGGYRFFEGCTAILPEALLWALASAVAFLLFHILRLRREVALSNLAIAFPEKTPEERKQIAYLSYRHFAGLLLEFMKLSRWSPEKLEKMIHMDTPDMIERFFSGDTSVIVAAAHFGNWEFGIARLATGWKPAFVIQKRQRNRKIDLRMAETRRRWSMGIIYSRGAVNKALQVLKENRIVGLLADQDAGKRGIFVPFLNRLASTPGGAAALHLRSGVPIVFAYVIREGKFRYRLGVIPVKYEGAYKVTRENVAKITAEFTQLLERLVRQYPEQYFWMHRRWKSRPVGE